MLVLLAVLERASSGVATGPARRNDLIAFLLLEIVGESATLDLRIVLRAILLRDNEGASVIPTLVKPRVIKPEILTLSTVGANAIPVLWIALFRDCTLLTNGDIVIPVRVTALL
jgi:hypothetical protein